MRLIDIEAVLKAAELAGKEYVSIDFLKDFEQVDAVPVVRCRECKHFMEYREDYTPEMKGANGDCRLRVNYSVNEHFWAVTYDDYCSCGAKMEDKPCG